MLLQASLIVVPRRGQGDDASMAAEHTANTDCDAFTRVCIDAIAIENDGRRALGSFCKCNRVLATVARRTGSRVARLDEWLLDESLEWSDEIGALYDRFVAVVRRGEYVEGQGNFGDEPDYGPAHPKFVECRLTERGLREIRPG